MLNPTNPLEICTDMMYNKMWQMLLFFQNMEVFKMLVNAKQILVSELVLAEQSNKDEMEELVDTKINNSFMLFRGNDDIKTSVVEKFIPFTGATSNATQNNQNNKDGALGAF